MAIERGRVIKFLVLMGIIGFLTFLVPQSIGLGAAGFSSAETIATSNFYVYGGVFAIFVSLFFFASVLIKEDDEKYGSSIAFSSLGENPSPSFFKRFSLFQFAWLCTIFFGIAGLISLKMPQLTRFTEFVSLEQQFTPTAELTYSTLLIPGAENLGLALVIAAAFLTLRFISRKTNMDSTSYKIMALTLIPLVGGLYGVINHLLRYQGSDLSMLIVFFFWLIMSFLIVFTGTFLIGYFLHMTNNFFFDIRGIVGNLDNVFNIGIIIMIIIIIIYGFIYRKKLIGAK